MRRRSPARCRTVTVDTAGGPERAWWNPVCRQDGRIRLHRPPRPHPRVPRGPTPRRSGSALCASPSRVGDSRPVYDREGVHGDSRRTHILLPVETGPPELHVYPPPVGRVPCSTDSPAVRSTVLPGSSRRTEVHPYKSEVKKLTLTDRGERVNGRRSGRGRADRPPDPPIPVSGVQWTVVRRGCGSAEAGSSSRNPSWTESRPLTSVTPVSTWASGSPAPFLRWGPVPRDHGHASAITRNPEGHWG